MSSRPPILALKSVRLADGPRMLFDGADLALEPRVRAALVGANGAGKSTLLRMLAGLIEPDGAPTRRGILFSFFHNGEGLAVAAALEDEGYPIEDLVFDLGNLRAGPRFAEDESPLGGRLGALFIAM